VKDKTGRGVRGDPRIFISPGLNAALVEATHRLEGEESVKSIETTKTYKIWWRRLFSSLSTTRFQAEDITQEDLKRFVGFYRNKSSNTQLQARRATNRLIDTLEIPLQKLPYPRTQARTAPIPQDWHVRKLWDGLSSRAEGTYSQRLERLIVAFVNLMGLRISEISRIKIEHLSFSSDSLVESIELIRKHDHRDVVGISILMAEEVKAWMEFRESSEFPRPIGTKQGTHLIPSRSGKAISVTRIGQIIRGAIKKVDLFRERGMHPHGLRHFYIQSLVDDNVPPAHIIHMTGHRRLNHLEPYLHRSAKLQKQYADQLSTKFT
jgi:integrase